MPGGGKTEQKKLNDSKAGRIMIFISVKIIIPFYKVKKVKIATFGVLYFLI